MPHRTKNTRATLTGTLGIATGALVALFAVFVALSAPQLALGVVLVSTAIALATRRGLTALVNRHSDEIRELSVPGVGTVRFRVVPR